jgi:hypothetical protein
VIRRENNVLEVDFSREPDPPAPRFPGASGLRELPEEDNGPDWSFGEVSWAWDRIAPNLVARCPLKGQSRHSRALQRPLPGGINPDAMPRRHGKPVEGLGTTVIAMGRKIVMRRAN